MSNSDLPAGSEPTFEELMDQLEEVTARLAAGDVGIEATAELYERAERIHALAKARLDQVRARVEGLLPGGVAGGSGVAGASGVAGGSSPGGEVGGEGGGDVRP